MPSKVSSDECTMMKKRGTKRKIEIKKRETKQQRSVACTKRRQTLFSKAADLCLLTGGNIAVFVTAPAENSDVVYSFSGYSSAAEIADCYLNGKSPPKIVKPKLGFWWEDPDLYRNCNDLSELQKIEDRLMRTKEDLMACLARQEKAQFNSEQNPNSMSLASFEQNPYYSSLERICGEPSSQVTWYDQNPSSSSLDQNRKSSSPSSCQTASFEQNSYYSSLERICGEPSSQVSCYDQNPNFPIQDTYVESQSRYLVSDDLGFVDSVWEEAKGGVSLSQDTQQTASFSSLEKICGEPSSLPTYYDQNPSFPIQDIYGESQSRYLVNDNLGFVDSVWETEERGMILLSQETQQIASFSSMEKICDEPSSQATCYDQNHSFPSEDIYGESQSRYLVSDDPDFVDSVWETEKSQETQETNEEEDQSLWEDLVNMLGLNDDNNINMS